MKNGHVPVTSDDIWGRETICKHKFQARAEVFIYTNSIWFFDFALVTCDA